MLTNFKSTLCKSLVGNDILLLNLGGFIGLPCLIMVNFFSQNKIDIWTLMFFQYKNICLLYTSDAADDL